MTIERKGRKTKVYQKRRPRRLSAVERVVERAEDRYWNRVVEERRRDPANQRTIPWEEVKRELGL